MSSKTSTNNDASPIQLESGEHLGLIFNASEPSVTNGTGHHIPRGDSTVRVDRTSSTTPSRRRLPSPGSWLQGEIVRQQPAATGNASEAKAEAEEIRPSSKNQPNERSRGDLPPLQIPLHTPYSSPQSAVSRSSAKSWSSKLEHQCRLCKKTVIIMDPAKAVDGILCRRCKEEQASPSRASNRDSVGLSEQYSPSKSMDVEDHNLATGLHRSSAHNQSPATAAGRNETSGPDVQRPPTPKTLPMGLRNPGNRPSKKEYRYQYTGGTRESLPRPGRSSESTTAGASTTSQAQVATRTQDNAGEEIRPPQHTAAHRLLGHTLPLENAPSTSSRQLSLASQRTTPLSSGEATPCDRPSLSAQSYDSVSKANFQSASVSTAISSRTSTASPVRPKSQTPKSKAKSHDIEREQRSTEGATSISNRATQNPKKSESPKKGATAPSRVNESSTNESDFARRQRDKLSQLNNTNSTAMKPDPASIERSPSIPVSRKGVKSVPGPKVKPGKSVDDSRTSTSRSHSERTTQNQSPTTMDTEMVDAEPGASDNDEASADEKVKLDKPALTWKELISLGLRRNESGVGMTSNEVVDWIQNNVPGYKREAIKGSVAAVLSKYGQEPNNIFHKTLNPNEGPKWVWSLVRHYKDFIDVEKVEDTYAAALSNSTPRRRKPFSAGVSAESPSTRKGEARNKQSGSISTSTKYGGVTRAARKTARERSKADSEPTDDESSEEQPRRPVRKTSLATHKPSTPARVRTKRQAPPSSSSGDSEDEQPAVKTPSKVKRSTLNKTTISDSDDVVPSSLRRSGRKITSNKRSSQNQVQSPVQTQSQSPNVFSTRSGRQIKPTLKFSTTNKRYDQAATAYSDINRDGTEGGYFSDLEVKGSRAAKDLGPAATSAEAFLSEAFGHLDAEDAEQEAKELPLFKQYDEDPLYGGNVEYSVKDLFAARPDKDAEQNGTLFDRDAKMKEIAKRPKRSDLRRYRKENRGESMPYLRTIRGSRNPKNPYVEKERSVKLWDEDDDVDKYANSDEDFEGDVMMLFDEDGVRKYKNMQELFEMPSEPKLGLDRDERLVFREPQAIGANGRVKRSRREWRVEFPKGI